MASGLLLLRVVIGGTILAHGGQKLFGWFGGPGLRGTAGFFGSLGWRMPLAMAFLAGLGESSGLLFALGLLTPLAALGIATVMLNAIIAVHWKNGFFNSNGGLEFPLTIATVAVAVAAIGPGRFSLDRALHLSGHLSGVWWGVGVGVAAIALTAVSLTVLRRPSALHEQPAA
ncbi:MAG TPA: DoxX family protein [Gaiellaceae bacterium]